MESAPLRKIGGLTHFLTCAANLLIPIYLTDKGLQHVFMKKSYILLMEMSGAIDVFMKETFSVGQSNWRPV